MSQKADILQCLKMGLPLTQLRALKVFGCFRLSARIEELKREGHKIKTEIVKKNNKRFARYRMEN